MKLAYGTKLTSDLIGCEAAAVSMHSHYYTGALGWLFRVEAVSYAAVNINVWGGEDYYRTDPSLELFAFPVKRWTPCGATLKDIWSGARERFVDLRPDRKQWASRSAREAVEQLALRRQRQDWVLSKQLAHCRREKALADAFLEKAPACAPTPARPAGSTQSADSTAT